MTTTAWAINKETKVMMKNNELRMLNVLMGGAQWTGKTWEEVTAMIPDMLTLRRLAKKHHRLAEMDCNGEGVIRGQHYYNGTIDDYARREYGYHVKSAYRVLSTTLKDPRLAEETTIFNIESEKVEGKIKAICDRLGLRVEFQGDPRGCTVKIFKGNQFLDIQS